MQIYHKVATSTDTVVFVRKGFRGLAWVAAYGSYILGLPVGALHRPGVQVPIARITKLDLDLSAEVTSVSFSLLVN